MTEDVRLLVLLEVEGDNREVFVTPPVRSSFSADDDDDDVDVLPPAPALGLLSSAVADCSPALTAVAPLLTFVLVLGRAFDANSSPFNAWAWEDC